MKFEIELSEVEIKALSFIMSDPKEWTQNAISERARIAIEDIVMIETNRMLNDPNINEIPSTKEEIVMNYNPIIVEDMLPV